MTEIEAKMSLEVRSKADEIYYLLTSKNIKRTETEFYFHGYNKPQRFKSHLDQLINSFIPMVEDLVYVVEPEILAGIMKSISRKLSKAHIVVEQTYKNPNWNQEVFELFQKFRAVQVEARVNLLKRLKPEAHSQYRSQKYTWMGNRKQLIELFFTLMEKNWIHVDKNLSKELQCLPIIETFNIYENGDNVPLNEAAFNKAWKDFTSSNSSTRKQHTPVFENLNSLK